MMSETTTQTANGKTSTQASYERTQELTEKLEAGMQELFSSDKYKDYLNTMSKFHRYSRRNIMLIHLQNPHATRVAGFNLWKKEFGRQVNGGEKALWILAPVAKDITREKEKTDPETGAPLLDKDGHVITETISLAPVFRPVPVFDISQTNGDPLPELVEPLTGDVAHYEAFLDTLEAVSPLPISFEPLPPGQDGYCQYGEQIGIREDMSEASTISTIIHELVHARLHDGGNVEQADQIPRYVKEIEAESITYVVAQRFGIETAPNSFGYLASWGSRDMNEIKASLHTIQKESSQLIDAIDTRFRAICKDRGIEYEQTEQGLPEQPDEKPAWTTVDVEKADTFTIYQLKSGEETQGHRFSGLESLSQRGLFIDPNNYVETYRAPLPANETLEGIFQKFNNDRPEDFAGHSLSVSDVVVLRKDGEKTAHYVDSSGFAELSSFTPGGAPREQSPQKEQSPQTSVREAQGAAKEAPGLMDALRAGAKRSAQEFGQKAPQTETQQRSKREESL